MRKLDVVPTLWSLLTVLLLTACQPIRPDQDTYAQAALTTTAADNHAVAATQATLITLQPPSVGEALTADEIFNAISPAVAFVDAPAGGGVAILIEDNYLLAHARAVWPFTEVDVFFPDGSEHPAAPVAGWDLVTGLALIGPIETRVEPLPLVDGNDLPVGSDVYLVGFPAGYRKTGRPEPVITAGILSRLLRWETIDYTFFRVDDAGAEKEVPIPKFSAGILSRLLNWDATDYTSFQVFGSAIMDPEMDVMDQNAGVMVTQTGDVVGFSDFAFSGFKLAGSIADALPRLNTILGHNLGVTIEQRGLPRGEGRYEIEGALRDVYDDHRYLLQAPVGAEVDIIVKSSGLREFSYDTIRAHRWAGGFIDPIVMTRGLAFTVSSSDPYIIEVGIPSANGNSYTLTSSHPLLAHPRPGRPPRARRRRRLHRCPRSASRQRRLRIESEGRRKSPDRR